MSGRILVIRGLGRAPVKRSKKRVRGRGPNERELNAIRADRDDDTRTAKGMAKKRIRGDCRTRKRQVARAGREAVELVKGRAREAVDAAKTECEAAREGRKADARLGRELGAPLAQRRAQDALNAEAVHDACGVTLPAVRDQARAALNEIRHLRRAGNAAASEVCERTREEVPRLLGGYLAEREARAARELAETRAAQNPERKPRTARQERADKARAAKMRGKTRKRAGGPRTAVEEADMEGANIPAEWHWLWRRHALAFVRDARKRNEGHAHAIVSPSELFADWLAGHGVRDMWKQGPEQSDFAPEYERLVLAEVDRERLEHELDEAEAAGYTRDEAREMMREAIKLRSAGPHKPKATKPKGKSAAYVISENGSGLVDLDDVADLFG